MTKDNPTEAMIDAGFRADELCVHNGATEAKRIAEIYRYMQSAREPKPAGDVEAMARAIHKAKSDSPYPWFHSNPDKCVMSRHIAERALATLQSADPVEPKVSSDVVNFAWTGTHETDKYAMYPPYVNLTGNRLAVRGPEYIEDGHPHQGHYVAIDLPDAAIATLRASELVEATGFQAVMDRVDGLLGQLDGVSEQIRSVRAALAQGQSR